MSRKKELAINTALIGIGNMGTKVFSILLLPLYTSLLSTEEYGIYDLINTIVIFLLPVITLLMEESMFRFLIDCKTESEKKNIISHSVLYCIIMTIIASIIIIIVGNIFNFSNIYITLLFLISHMILNLKNAVTRGLSKIKLYSVTNFLSSALIIILNIFFIAVMKTGYMGLLFSAIISNITISIFVLAKLRIHKYINIKNINKNQMKEMIKYSCPLVPNSISWGIINMSDRLIISSFIDTSANGIYSMANKFPTFMDTIYGFFYTAWKESAAKSRNDDDVNIFYNKINDLLRKLLLSLVLGIITFLPIFFPILIKKDFSLSYIYIPLLLIAMFFSNMSGFYGGIFSAYKDTKIMGTTTVISAIINLVIDIALIQCLGIWAAVISTVMSTFFVYIFRRIKIRKYIKFKTKFNIFPTIAIIINIIVYYFNNNIIHYFLACLTSIFIIIYNKDLIIDLIKSLKTRIKISKVKN